MNFAEELLKAKELGISPEEMMIAHLLGVTVEAYAQSKRQLKALEEFRKSGGKIPGT